jgi:hypothetical protein
MVGLQMGNTAIPSYIIDCYPLQSMSVITFYSVMLDLSALINPVSSTYSSEVYKPRISKLTFMIVLYHGVGGGIRIRQYLYYSGDTFFLHLGSRDWTGP